MRSVLDQPTRLFLLSPANLAGARGRQILGGTAQTPLAKELRDGGSVPLGAVYATISSLYFRGKLEYARRFGRRSEGPAVLAITPNRGLLSADHSVDMEQLAGLAQTRIDPDEASYARPLGATARALRRDLAPGADVVLLGSIATGKYLDPLVDVFGLSLLFPRDFIGRGDMSRGGLLLRAVDAGEELDYVVAVGSVRRGPRPERLAPVDRPGSDAAGW
jgi:hypothetical protein